jgi:hypothetical protein
MRRLTLLPDATTVGAAVILCLGLVALGIANVPTASAADWISRPTARGVEITTPNFTRDSIGATLELGSQHAAAMIRHDSKSQLGELITKPAWCAVERTPDR